MVREPKFVGEAVCDPRGAQPLELLLILAFHTKNSIILKGHCALKIKQVKIFGGWHILSPAHAPRGRLCKVTQIAI